LRCGLNRCVAIDFGQAKRQARGVKQPAEFGGHFAAASGSQCASRCRAAARSPNCAEAIARNSNASSSETQGQGALWIAIGVCAA
jgi:hypothetical protein